MIWYDLVRSLFIVLFFISYIYFVWARGFGGSSGQMKMVARGEGGSPEDCVKSSLYLMILLIQMFVFALLALLFAPEDRVTTIATVVTAPLTIICLGVIGVKKFNLELPGDFKLQANEDGNLEVVEVPANEEAENKA